MKSETIPLKSGKSISLPAYFPNPQSGPEGELLREMLTRHSLDALEGIVLNLEDIPVVQDNLHLQTQIIDGSSDKQITDTVLLINPDMSLLFGVPSTRDAESVTNLDIFPDELSERFQRAEDETGDRQRYMKMMGLYPVLSGETLIQRLFEYQIDLESDTIAPPSIPLNSKIDFDTQLTGISEIFKTSNQIATNRDLSGSRDLMHVLSIDPVVLDSPRNVREDKIVSLFQSPEPDIIGISLTNFDVEARQTNESILNIIKKLNQSTNAVVMMFNIREFGLLSFVFGAGAISTPVAKSPYFRMTQGAPPAEGNYYHKEKMADYSKRDLMNQTSIIRNNFQLPCDCPACSNQQPMHQLETEAWNTNRKRHFVFTKESEVRQLRETSKPVPEALRDKFGRSERPEFTKYLP